MRETVALEFFVAKFFDARPTFRGFKNYDWQWSTMLFPGFNIAQYGGMAVGLVFLAYWLQKIRSKKKTK